MEDLRKIQILSDRLKIVPVTMKFKEDIFKGFQPPVTDFIRSVPPKEIKETEEYIKKFASMMAVGEEMFMAITDKNTGEFLGCCGLHNLSEDPLSTGLWIKKEAHGNGYGREAMTALVQWASKNLKFSYIKYSVVEQNIPSRKIAESLGAKVEKRYQETMMSGKVFPLVEYWIYPR